MAYTPPRAPEGLSLPRKKLWKVILTEHKLAAWELEILEDACRTKDLIATLDGDIAISELKTTGFMDQEILNDSIKERRMQGAHLIKLSASLKLPDAQQIAGVGQSRARTAASHARKAAQGRWAKPPTRT